MRAAGDKARFKDSGYIFFGIFGAPEATESTTELRLRSGVEPLITAGALVAPPDPFLDDPDYREKQLKLF